MTTYTKTHTTYNKSESYDGRVLVIHTCTNYCESGAFYHRTYYNNDGKIVHCKHSWISNYNITEVSCHEVTGAYAPINDLSHQETHGNSSQVMHLLGHNCSEVN